MNRRNLLLVLIPTLLYTAHAAFYWDWIIDDAGISIAYANNLVSGHGLVAQPGVEPVEGFSNPLWTMLLALSMATGTFSTYWTIKLLSCALAAGTFAAMLTFCRLSVSVRSTAEAVFLGASIATAFCPAFVIWTSSGLENGLLAALTCTLMALCAAWRPERPMTFHLVAGLVAGSIAMTRPDGLIYSVIFPALLALYLRRKAIKPVLIYVAGFLLVVAPYEMFRIIYFGDFVPNTFHAKPGTSLLRPLKLVMHGLLTQKVSEPFRAGAATLGNVAALVFLLAPLFFLILSRWNLRALLISYAFSVAAMYAYISLPMDWMPMFRFASVLFPIGSIFFLLLLTSALEGWKSKRIARQVLFLSLLVPAMSLRAYSEQASAFIAAPTTPLEMVSESVGLNVNWYRSQFGIEDASVLSMDLGGALIYSELKVVDLAGLCDRNIAPLIHRKREPLLDYLLTVVRPTFVHANEEWLRISHLRHEERFHADYLRLSAKDWVRRDALGKITDQEALLIVSRKPDFDLDLARPFPLQADHASP